MLRSASAASALLALALGTPAFAAHPEHYRPLHPHTDLRPTASHLLARHFRPGPHHAAAILRERHPLAVSAHPGRHAAPASRYHAPLIPQPPLLRAHARPPARLADTATPTSVVAIIRPANIPRPQLPAVADVVIEPVALPRLYDERGRLLVPAALVGSHEILLHQNQMADQDGLGRIQNDADLEAMRQRGMLVALPAGPALVIDDRLPTNRRCARPWTAQFLADLSRDYFRRFHTPLQLTSAVRTVEFQQQLTHRNGNAAPPDGDTASPHLTGQAIDLGKRGMTLPEIAWMRGYLLPLIQDGRIDVEEEFKQSCFHISVYRAYAPPPAARYSVASRGTTGSLATVLP